SDTGATQLVTYMPLEDLESTDTPLIIGNTSGKAVALSGTFNWSQNSALPGSKPAVQLTGNSYLIMNVASHSFAGHWQFDFFYYLANYPTADTILFRCWVGNTGASGISFWDIIMKTGAYRVIAYDRNVVAKVDSGDVINSGWVLNTWMHHRVLSIGDMLHLRYPGVDSFFEVRGSLASAVTSAQFSYCLMEKKTKMPLLTWRYSMHIISPL